MLFDKEKRAVTYCHTFKYLSDSTDVLWSTMFLIPTHNLADWRGACCLKAAERSENTSPDYWWHTELGVASH